MKYSFKYLMFGFIFFVWTKNSYATTYSENISRLRVQVEIDLKSRFSKYSEKNKCYLKEIDKDSPDIDDLFPPPPDAVYYCLKIKRIEYKTLRISRDYYQTAVYIFIEGPSVNKEMEILDPFSFSETSNTQSYAYYLLVAQADGDEKIGFKPNLAYHHHLFYTDVVQNGTDIICINAGKKNIGPRVGFSASKTSFLGLGLNGYEFDKVTNIIELSSGLFAYLNSYEVKTSNYLIYESGACKKRK